MVFQNYALFPHMTVGENLSFPLEVRGMGKSDREAKVKRALDMVRLGEFADRRPAQLSGGQAQRVAVARALVFDPEVVLMDEPLASLDAERKLEILPLIESLRDAFGIPIVYVSHAVEEVARLASHVVVLDGGRVVASGAVEDVLGAALKDAGLSRFARSSVIAGTLSAVDAEYGLAEVSHPAGKVWLAGCAGFLGGDVRVIVKSTDITLAKELAHGLSIRNALSGTVAGIETDDGPFAGVTINLEGHGHLFALATRKAIDELKIGQGQRVFALIKTVALDERAVALIES